jgi:hypothetical protein
MRYIISLFLIFALHIDMNAQRRVRFIEVSNIEEWEEVLETSRANRRLLFINVCSNWSEVCNFMSRNTFRDRELAKFITDDYVPVYIEAEGEFGEIWRDRYNADKFPVLVYMTPGERILTNLIGYQEKTTIMDSGRRAMTIYREYPRLRQAYIEKGLSSEGWRALISLELANEGPEGARPLFTEYIESKAKDRWDQGYNLELICTFGAAPGEDVYEYVKRNREQLRINPEFKADEYFENSFNHTMAVAVKKKDASILRKIEDDLFFWSDMNSDEKRDMVQEMYRTFYLRTGNWEKFEEMINDLADRASSGRETILALEARFLIENFMEPEAINVAIRLMEESIKARVTFEKYLFLAQAYVNLEKYDEAVAVLQKAREGLRDPYDQYEVDNYINRVRQIQVEKGRNKSKTD